MFFQFQSTAPSGVLSKQSFVDTLETALLYLSETLRGFV
jgi:hypothetical protein